MDKEAFKALSVHSKKYKSIVMLCKVSLKREFICVLLYKQEKKKEGNCKGGDNKAWVSCSVQLVQPCLLESVWQIHFQLLFPKKSTLSTLRLKNLSLLPCGNIFETGEIHCVSPDHRFCFLFWGY